ncbi:MAG: hypothetical protein K9H48_17580 [Melioribacteraceae bacterium]|nr:hypothetical protein [Melioribacteraceae bacterium]MCF8395715.1 hypothetical protein [Melioribacteraceae bacterium]MCF8421213.1 hypothetical protein [Melioribacteraceae bacterium]
MNSLNEKNCTENIEGLYELNIFNPSFIFQPLAMKVLKKEEGIYYCQIIDLIFTQYKSLAEKNPTMKAIYENLLNSLAAVVKRKKNVVSHSVIPLLNGDYLVITIKANSMEKIFDTVVDTFQQTSDEMDSELKPILTKLVGEARVKSI